MSDLSHPPSADFAARVARIEARRVSRPSRGVAPPRGRGRFVASLFGALFSGYLVIMLSRYARFHLTGMVPGDTGVELGVVFGDLVMATMASTVLAMIFKFRSKEHAAAKAMGMAVGLFTMHMLVHRAPDLFTVAFSEVWVYRVISLTDASTLAIF